MLDALAQLSSRFMPFLAVTTAVVASLAIINWVLRRRWKDQPDMGFRFQLIMLSLTVVGILAVVIALPIGDTLRGQLLGLMGILLSAAIALSSTTFIGNILAGIMMRVVKSARPGDFLMVMDITGRVTEMGLLHTEVQTEDRDLVTIPNLVMATQPVKVVRSTGTIVSAEVSLGYDVPRREVSNLLCQAAETAELSDAFVQIRELGDYSVQYRVAGLLREVTSLISARSNLRAAMLDALHEADIEIVSPNFMNTRSLDKAERIIPSQSTIIDNQEEVTAEAIIFDKADAAASQEKIRASMTAIESEIAKLNEDKAPASARRLKKLEIERSRLLKELELANTALEKSSTG